MLHYKLEAPLVRETHARAALNQFASMGAAIHRVGRDQKEFILLVPVRRPHKRDALLKILERNSFGQRFVLVDVRSFVNGPQFRAVDESELNGRGELITPSETAYLDDTEGAGEPRSLVIA